MAIAEAQNGAFGQLAFNACVKAVQCLALTSALGDWVSLRFDSFSVKTECSEGTERPC
jgi:hypothetical protein